jgi:hypothetical protein
MRTRKLSVPRTAPHQVLAIDLGNYKSVACNYVTTGTARFATVVTHILELDRLMLSAADCLALG